MGMPDLAGFYGTREAIMKAPTAEKVIDKHVGRRVRMRRLMLGMSQTKLGASPDYVIDFLATSDGLALAKAFVAIRNARLRRCIVDLVEQIAEQ
jgi:hypothetical protein